MPDAVLMHKDDQLGSGQTVFKNTGVEWGDDGVKGLVHYVPHGQGDWHIFDNFANHEHSKDYDSGTSRINERVEAMVTGSTSSNLRKRLLLPKDFGSFVGDAIKIIVYRSGTISMAASLYTAGAADAGVSFVDITPASNVTYEQFLLTPTGVYMPGDFMTLEIAVSTDTAGEYALICDLEVVYRTKRGNI